MRRRHSAPIGALALGLTMLHAGETRADEGWTLDPSGSGEWVAEPAPPTLPAPAAEEPRWAGAGATREADAAPRRSGGAIAGGVVLTSVGALFAGFGGLGLAYGATTGDADGMAAAGVVTALGLAGTAGGIALIVWGAQRERPGAALVASPQSVYLEGHF